MRVFIVYLSTQWGVHGWEHHIIALSGDEAQLGLVTMNDVAVAKAKLKTELKHEITTIAVDEITEGYHEVFKGGF